jgi:GGDEF domain-containing protein
VTTGIKRPGTRGGGGRRASTRSGEAERPAPARKGPPPPPRGNGGRAQVPAASAPAPRPDSLEIDIDVQLVDEAPAAQAGSINTGPSVRVALHEQTAGQLGMLRAVVDTFRHTVVAAGAGADGVAAVLAAMRDEDPPGVVFAGPGGEAILDAARKLEPRRPVVVLTGAGGLHPLAERADRLGAELFVPRPHEPERLGPIVVAAARLAAERAELIAIRGAHQVLRRKVDHLDDADPPDGSVLGFEAFRRTLELELKRSRRFGYPLSVALLELTADELPAGADRILRARATGAVVATVRDIDMVTELDGQRYLVLLPYTDGPGAQQVALRLIQAVAELPAVSIGGATARGELRVGVAGAREGQPVSFAQLVKDATAALGKAKALGIDLVVNA